MNTVWVIFLKHNLQKKSGKTSGREEILAEKFRVCFWVHFCVGSVCGEGNLFGTSFWICLKEKRYCACFFYVFGQWLSICSVRLSMCGFNVQERHLANANDFRDSVKTTTHIFLHRWTSAIMQTFFLPIISSTTWERLRVSVTMVVDSVTSQSATTSSQKTLAPHAPFYKKPCTPDHISRTGLPHFKGSLWKNALEAWWYLGLSVVKASILRKRLLKFWWESSVCKVKTCVRGF